MAADGDVAKGLATLDRLEAMLEQAFAAGGQADAPTGGLVAYRKALLAFQKTKSEVAAGVNSLQQAIPSGLPQEAELAAELVATIQKG